MGFIKINILRNKCDGPIECNADLEWALSHNKTESIVINTDYITYVSELKTCKEYYQPGNILGRYFYIRTKHNENFTCKESEYDGIVRFLTCYA